MKPSNVLKVYTMSQALIEFLSISISIAFIATSWIAHKRQNQIIKDQRKYNAELLEKQADQDFQITILRAKLKDQEGYYENELAFLKAVTEAQAALLGKTHKELLKALKDLAFHADSPLFYVSDADLPEVIKEELEIRYANSINPTDYKLASKCGGKAFRVVDAIKRGKL